MSIPELGLEYDRKHKEFKKIIDSTLSLNENFNDVNIDHIWTLSKYYLNNKSTIVLNLKKDSKLTESTREFLKKEFDKI